MRIDVAGIGIALEVHEPRSGRRPGDGAEATATVLCIHGWPDTRHLWRHQVGPLTDAGFRVITPDLRGFGDSDRPARIEDASIGAHLGDLLGVLDHLGVGRAHVVGHDWGAALAWVLATLAPERVDRLVAISVGHPAAFAAAGLPQREKSWYMLAFQFAGVAERWLAADDFANFRAWSAHPDADEVAARLADPDALAATLAIYRANVGPESLLAPPPVLPEVAAPTLGIWSTGDMALTEEQMTGSAAHLTGPWRYERLEGVGHWIHLEAPEALNRLLLDFLPR